MGKPGGRASPKKVASAEDLLQALELRKGGATYLEIGQVLGITFQAAHKRVKAALRQTLDRCEDEADEIVALTIERLDRWLLALTAKCEAGHLGAIDRALRIEDQRARLKGLYVTFVKDISDEDSPLSPEEAIKIQAKLLEQASLRGLDYADPDDGGTDGDPGRDNGGGP